MLVFLYLVLFLIVFKLYQKLTAAKCKCIRSMENQIVIVTGANTGIGFEAAKVIAAKGAKVILACRNEDKGKETKIKIIQETGNEKVLYKQLDLSSLKSVRNFVKDFKQTEGNLDVLINNAGVFAMKSDLSEDGIVGDMQVNHFAPFLLTNLLIPLLKKSKQGRIVNVSSIIHYFGVIDFKNINTVGFYGNLRRYCNSKLCNVLFTVELARRLNNTKVTANCVHPGVVYTSIFQSWNCVLKFVFSLVYFIFFKTPKEGSETTIHAAVSKECGFISGTYLADCKKSLMSGKGCDQELCVKLWDFSVKLVKLKSSEVCV